MSTIALTLNYRWSERNSHMILHLDGLKFFCASVCLRVRGLALHNLGKIQAASRSGHTMLYWTGGALSACSMLAFATLPQMCYPVTLQGCHGRCSSS
eukprot:5351955-Amphidinium_carterae.1